MPTKEEVLQAYRLWKSEENRDRGYDHDLVVSLQQKYHRLLSEFCDERFKLTDEKKAV